MKSNQRQHLIANFQPSVGLAVLNKFKGHANVAVLTYALDAIDTSNINRVQILPAGIFKPTDGREVDTVTGHWLMDEQAAAMLQASASQRKNPFHFDYEHQTLKAEENGQPAPAAGWFKRFEFLPGDGLYALDVDWTKKAATFIANKEYCYASAVFAYDTATGRPIELLHVALTNDPAVDGMKAIQALSKQHSTNPTTTTTGEKPMNEALKVLFGLLGVDVAGVDFADPAALSKVQGDAKTAIAALKAKADKAGTLEGELNTARQNVAALKAQSKGDGDIDLSQYVPIDTYNQLVTQVAALSKDNSANAISQVLTDNENKILASEKDYLQQFGKQQGVAALSKLLANRPEITALSKNQTHDKAPEETPGDGELTHDEKYAADQLGISYAAFSKQKKANKDNK